jgi:hypothetical protein
MLTIQNNYNSDFRHAVKHGIIIKYDRSDKSTLYREIAKHLNQGEHPDVVDSELITWICDRNAQLAERM